MKQAGTMQEPTATRDTSPSVILVDAGASAQKGQEYRTTSATKFERGVEEESSPKKGMDEAREKAWRGRQGRVRSETVLDRVRKEGVCSGYVAYITCVGVLFCAVMLGIVIWGDVIAKVEDPKVDQGGLFVKDDQLVMTGTPQFLDFPTAFDHEGWFGTSSFTLSLSAARTVHHRVTGVDKDDDTTTVTLYTNQNGIRAEYDFSTESEPVIRYYDGRKCTEDEPCEIANTMAESEEELAKESSRRRLGWGYNVWNAGHQFNSLYNDNYVFQSGVDAVMQYGINHFG